MIVDCALLNADVFEYHLCREAEVLVLSDAEMTCVGSPGQLGPRWCVLEHEQGRHQQPGLKIFCQISLCGVVTTE